MGCDKTCEPPTQLISYRLLIVFVVLDILHFDVFYIRADDICLILILWGRITCQLRAECITC